MEEWLECMKVLLLTLASLHCCCHGYQLTFEPTGHIPTLTWAVKLNLETTFLSPEDINFVADIVARETGLTNRGQIGHLEGYYLFEHKDHVQGEIHDVFFKKSRGINDAILKEKYTLYHHNGSVTGEFLKIKKAVHDILGKHMFIEWHEQQVVRSRQKRELTFNDPAYPQQWHLHNTREAHMDINVTGVWERNVTGKGTIVCVVDDGLEWHNPDIKENYSPEGSWDLNSDDPDPTPHPDKGSNHHGTRCAGEIAAVVNTVCAVGVAYKAKVSGLRVLDGPMTDSLEATAFNKNFQVNDIYSCSWGPDDDGKTVDGPHPVAWAAIRHGVVYGRQGYGSIFVVASGNGGRFQDNCNYDGYANSIYTVTIGAVDEQGHMPFYAEECAAMLAVTFSSGGGTSGRSIVTTDWTMKGSKGCTMAHTGTSAAAPIAAGLVALMLDVRPCLTWRDVQFIIVITAVKVDDVVHWQTNKAGFHHSHKHGFGLLDAWRLVNAAKIWDPLPWMSLYQTELQSEDKTIPRAPSTLEVEYDVSQTKIDGFDLFTLEYAQVEVTISHPQRGLLKIELVCPSGTRSLIATPRTVDRSPLGFQGWTFSTVRCWGEAPVGKWKLVLSDVGGASHRLGTLVNWRLKLNGSPMRPEELTERVRQVREAYSGVYLNDTFQKGCQPPPNPAPPAEFISDRTLKMLALTSLFLIAMALYESLEYAFCYGEEKKEQKRLTQLAKRAAHMARNNRSPRAAGEGQESAHLLEGDPSESTRLLDIGEVGESIPLQTFPLSADSDIPQSCASHTIDMQGDSFADSMDDHYLESEEFPSELLDGLSPEELRLNLSFKGDLNPGFLSANQEKVTSSLLREASKNAASSPQSSSIPHPVPDLLDPQHR